jgi:hypothetical protein
LGVVRAIRSEQPRELPPIEEDVLPRDEASARATEERARVPELLRIAEPMRWNLSPLTLAQGFDVATSGKACVV